MGEPHIYISSMMKERYIVVSGKCWVRPPKKCSDHAKAGVDCHSFVDLINQIVTRELVVRLRVDSVTYWTNSMIVLKYIANEEGRFVENRVAII